MNLISISAIDTDANGNNVDDDGDIEDGGNEPKLTGNGAGASHAEAGASTSIDPQPGTSSGIRNGSDNLVESADAEASENLQFAWEALEMAAKIFRRLGENKYLIYNC